MKVIEIKKCEDCPHISHTGAFTKGGSKPCCDHDTTVKLKGNDCFKRVIPYKNIYGTVSTTRVTKKIPEFCPLTDRQTLIY